MKLFKRNTGFTLVELVIVIAISLLLIGIVSGVFALRRQTAYDDAAQQVASSIQTIRNEAQQGSGVPVSGTNTTIATGDTIYGQTIKFRPNCNGSPCIDVNKLLSRNASGIPTLIPYENYQIAVPGGLQFVYYNNTFASSYNPIINTPLDPPASYGSCTGGGAIQIYCLTGNALNPAVLLAPNLQNNKMFLLKTPIANPPVATAENVLLSGAQSGVLFLALANNTDPAAATAQYYIAIDLSSNGTIKVIKVK